MTLRVGLEVGGVILPVKFGGADTVLVPPGGTVRSDAVMIDAAAGDLFYSRVTATMASGSTYVYTGISVSYAFNPVHDNSRSGTNYAGSGNQSVVPTRILGLRNAPVDRVFGLVGDSIMQGATDVDQWVGGFASALVDEGVPYVKITRGGEEGRHSALLGVAARRLVGIARCTDVIDPEAYRGCNVVERSFNALKNWRGLATRYDKLAVIYRGGAVLPAVLTWLRR
jgi:hypothetical protein